MALKQPLGVPLKLISKTGLPTAAIAPHNYENCYSIDSLQIKAE
jgi:hypothetical protein